MSQLPLDSIINLITGLTTGCLVGLTLLTCVGCLVLLFFFARRTQPGYLFDTVYKRRKAEEYDRVLEVEARKAVIEDEIAALQNKLKKSTEVTVKQNLEEELAQKQASLKATIIEVQQVKETVDREANRFAKAIIPARLEEYGPTFYIEFGTVIVIIFAVLGLAIQDVLQGQETATILAAIAGYVLGKSSRHSASQATNQVVGKSSSGSAEP